jgi:hypothetical protein
MEYNNSNNKAIGKVYGFDGEAGSIITKDDEYIFNIQNIQKIDNIQNDTIVAFYPSTVKFGNEVFKVAREVESLSKEESKTLQKERN